MRKVVLLLASIGMSAAVTAGTAAKLLECQDESNLGMRQCSLAEYKLADKELNTVYAKVLKSLKESYGPEEIKNAGGQDPVEDMKDAQRKWVVFRDANCKSLGTQMFGGSGQETIVAGCLSSMTKDRVKELKTFLPE